MTFSQSFEFGNSTFMKLESEVNHAINDENNRENVDLDVILESPTSKSTGKTSALSLTKDRSSLLLDASGKHKAQETSVNRRLRRSKSDTILPKDVGQTNSKVLDNCSKFFQSDFSFPYDTIIDNLNSIGHKNSSVLKVSQIEALFEDATVESRVPDSAADNSFEKPIFSEDLKGVFETDEDEFIWKDSLPFSDMDINKVNEDEHVEIIHDISSFICPPKYNKALKEQLLNKELEESYRVLKEIEVRENSPQRSISLSCMSPDQLKFAQHTTPIPKREKKAEQSSTELRLTQDNDRREEKCMNVVENDFEVESKETLFEKLDTLKCMKAWNLPMSVLTEYKRKGINEMFDWQIECLSNPKVLFERCNLVYSAPTSAGKTLVSEILLLKTVIERGKKVLLILPFISVVREKMFYLQDLLTSAGYRVEGFFGGYTPAGGFDSINVAICTIEKANSIVNKLLELGKLNDIGTVVVDEVHLISDPGRGYILELLLAKILYMSRKYGLEIQIVTMSATLADVKLLQKWLQAELYITDFRPVALKEMIKIGNKIYDNSLNVLRTMTQTSVNMNEPFPTLENDLDHVAQLCIETLVEGCSVVVFCPSKEWCENLCTQLAGAIHLLAKQGGEWGSRLRSQLNRQTLDDVKQQLRDIPTGLDVVLDKCITYGCAFHHAGLTTEERDVVEASFKSGALKVIVATSTLSSGVNLPARRVLIRSPLFGGKQMSSLTYRQMIGRAGRTGKDILGESILVCTESNARIGKELINADLRPLSSCLDFDSSTHLKRALLEVIASGVANSMEDIHSFVNCTLLSVQKRFTAHEEKEETISNEYTCSALDFLADYEFIRLQKNEETNEQHYVATRLGNACLASSMPPTDGLILFAELQKSRRCFVLESELHAVYLVTPYSVCSQLQNLDWLLFLDLWEKLTPAMKKVGELVGVKESFLVRAMRGQTKLDYKLMQIHKRFYTALALQELVNETPINVVAFKYKCTRGMLQTLQQMASTFAGIVTSFCNSLQWNTLSLIVSQFKERLYFGIQSDLIDLMRLPDLNHKRARALFDGGITSLIELANADILCIEKVLYNAFSFDSVKKHEDENDYEALQRNKARNFIITGKVGLTAVDAAKQLVSEARKFVQYEIGVGNIKWSQSHCDENGEEINDKNEMHMSYEKNEYNNDMVKYSLEKKMDQSKIITYKIPEKCKGITNLTESLGNEIGDNMKIRTISNEDQATPKVELNNNFVNVKKKNIDVLQFIVEPDNSSQKETLANCKLKHPVVATTEKNTEVRKKLPQINGQKSIKIYQNYREEPEILEKVKISENHENTISNTNKFLGDRNIESAATKRKSSESLNEILNVTPPKKEKSPNDLVSKIKVNNKVLTETTTVTMQTSVVQNNHLADTEEKPSTSKKAQRLLRAKQLSDLKKQEWTKRKDKKENQIMGAIQIKTSSTNEKPQTPNILKSPKLLRRSPRNHIIPNSIPEENKVKQKRNRKKDNNDIDKNEETFTINISFKDGLKEADNFKEPDIRQCKNMSSQEDEIPSSQHDINEIHNSNLRTPQSSRFLRSLRATQKTHGPKIKPLIGTTELQKFGDAKYAFEQPSSTSVELSDFSMENSLIKNPFQLNASHILSCSKVDNESSSFKSLDIIDICGDQQLFKGAFKEFMIHKRLGLCLGIQKQCGKRKPIIGSNLLLNQVAASEKDKSFQFQIDDTNYLAGIGFCLSENVVYYMNMQDDGSCKGLTSDIKCKYLHMLLKSTEHTLLIYDAKEQIKILNTILKYTGEIHIAIEDPKVANWLLQPDKNHNLYNLAQQFAPECSSLVNLCGSGRGYNSYGLDADSGILAKVRSSIEACVTVHILKGQIENLERIGSGQLHKFFIELEMPLQISLGNMENIGFPVSSAALHKVLQQVLDCMKKLEAKIYETNGSKFNLCSSSAVARVLGLHRTSSGRLSTSKQILEKIDSPISKMIITYRKLSTTLTKSLQPLCKCVKDERIHGESITFTSTGRISMAEPNLQNVAKDFEVVIDSEPKIISCRSAFLPADAKRCLISSDFCQLEMRILAHLSQDSALLHVVKSDKDLFVAIAARWHKIPESSVTEELRNGTKQICYGIVYGMGMRALAEALKCTEQEAKLVSEQFHAAYPGIRLYTEKVVKFARNNGYIETITGRRRYLQNITSEERSVKNQAERKAVNSTIQGSAADIAKSAILRMEKNIIKYHEKLGVEPHSVRLVLHLHDELIYEVPEEKSKKIAKVLSLTMENCVKLNVPLKVKVKIGKSWSELKEVKL